MDPSAETIYLRKHLFDKVDSQRTSNIEGYLSEEEKEFLWLVETGDLEEIRDFIKNVTINTDCCNFRGQRALDIAVINRDPELVTFLLDNLPVTTIHYYCAILQSVFENEENILEMLLNRSEEDTTLHEQLKALMNGRPECTNCLPEVAATNMTPTMAAATAGNIEITRMLLERGYSIKKPHNTNCQCKEYCSKREGETLTDSISRMNAYRALASPTYLILTSEDPILAAFELSQEMKKLSTQLPENQKDYQDLSKQCSKFGAAILNQCRITEEIQTVLVQKKGFTDPRPHRFSRLHLAVQYEQKEFVTHASCQQVLRSMWIETIGSWYSWSLQMRTVYVLKHALFTPFISLAFIFIPRTEIIKPLRVPLNRFIYFATSYLVFLTLLMMTLLNDRRYDVHSPVSWTEIAVGCYIVGYSWDILINFISIGISNYFRSWWAVFDFFMFTFFLVAEIFWYSIFIYNQFSKNNSHNSNRMDWFWYHPILIGEGIYAVASMMAFSRILLWFQVNSRLGPLGTTIKNMIADVFRFFVLFFILMLAFATGLNSIYKNYKESSRIEGEERVEQPDAFLTLKNTFKNLFWAIFGMGEPNYAQIIVGNSSFNKINSEEQNVDHMFTEGIGYTLWGLYHMVTVVVLLNMLIAMMTESYQRVQTNADMEWKFACSTLWLSIFDNQSIVPPPFNLIPSMHKIAVLIRWITAAVRGSFKDVPGKVSWSAKRCFFWESDLENSNQKAEEEKYEKLIVQLIRRYLHINKGRQSWYNFKNEFKDQLQEEISQELRRSFKRNTRKYTRRRHNAENRK